MQIAGFLLYLLLFHYFFLHNLKSYFLDNRPSFSRIFIDDGILNLRGILLLIVGRSEAYLISIAMIFMMHFLLHIGAVALERRSELFDHLFHFSSNT